MEIGQGFSFGMGVIFTFYFFLYIKSPCVLLFVVFLMEKGNKKLLKKNDAFDKTQDYFIERNIKPRHKNGSSNPQYLNVLFHFIYVRIIISDFLRNLPDFLLIEK